VLHARISIRSGILSGLVRDVVEAGQLHVVHVGRHGHRLVSAMTGNARGSVVIAQTPQNGPKPLPSGRGEYRLMTRSGFQRRAAILSPSSTVLRVDEARMAQIFD